MNVNQRIAWLRTTTDLSVREAAQLLGMSWSGLARIERGDRSPSLETLRKVHHVYGVSITWLLGMDGAVFPDKQDVVKSVEERRHGQPTS